MLCVLKSLTKHAQSLYVIRSTYVNGKHSSKVVENSEPMTN